MAASPSDIASRLKQGLHPDPCDPNQPPPDRSLWQPRRISAFASPLMDVYRATLLLPHVADVREAILDDLSEYYGFPKEECVERCIGWEAWSVKEWHAKGRTSPSDVADFYHSTHSWSFDLLWYAYLQSAGYYYPVSVAIARTLPAPPTGARLLDFGAGVGATAQLFLKLGYAVDLADISTTLQAFAQFRLERRGQSARYIDLNTDRLAPGAYDVITAIDTLVHVPAVQLPTTLKQLHAALKPGGFLFANFDTRPVTPENAWHLYQDDLPLRFLLQRVGFEPEESLDHMVTRYRKVNPQSVAHRLRGVRDVVAMRTPLRPLYRRARRAVRSALHRRGVLQV